MENMECNGIQTLLNDYEKLLKSYVEEKERRDRDDINLFSSISDAYKRENYNSDILRFILGPEGLGKMNRKNKGVYLRAFLSFIKIEDVDGFLLNLDDIEVTREENRIDILIRNKRNAIIIESKINGASDRPMQLVRYYKKVTEKLHLTVLKIVYLTVYPKRPELYYEENFDIDEDEFEKKKRIINKRLFKTFISDGKSNDDYNKFQDFLKGKEICKSDIIQQYKKLVDKLGGNTLEKEAEIISGIFGNEKDLKKVKEFMQLWENHGNTLCTIFYEKFPLNSNTAKWNKEDDEIFYSKDEVVKNIKLFYYPCSFNNTFEVQLGFHANPDVKNPFKGVKKKIVKIFTDLGYDEPIPENDEWLYIKYVYNEDKPLNAFFEEVVDKLKKMQEKAAEQLQ